MFKQVEEGRIRLAETMTLDSGKAVGGTGVLVHMGTPTLSIVDYATLMVTLSDNTATNVLIDRLGLPDGVATRSRQPPFPGCGWFSFSCRQRFFSCR